MRKVLALALIAILAFAFTVSAQKPFNGFTSSKGYGDGFEDGYRDGFDAAEPVVPFICGMLFGLISSGIEFIRADAIPPRVIRDEIELESDAYQEGYYEGYAKGFKNRRLNNTFYGITAMFLLIVAPASAY